MKKTVLCHFYNEEWMLPWWLNHHRQYFDHGIMIDYQSTDSSVNIIKEICPTWDIVATTNKDFNPEPVDAEVELYERDLSGWRVCLNVPEFLVGNYDRLTQVDKNTNIYVETITFIEPGSETAPTILDTKNTLIDQCSWILPPYFRSNRSIHNYPMKYTQGMHYYNSPTYDDLKIYYFGWASLQPESINRRMQIQTKTPGDIDPMSPHRFTKEELIEKFKQCQLTMMPFNLKS